MENNSEAIFKSIDIFVKRLIGVFLYLRLPSPFHHPSKVQIRAHLRFSPFTGRQQCFP